MISNYFSEYLKAEYAHTTASIKSDKVQSLDYKGKQAQRCHDKDAIDQNLLKNI